MSSKCGAESGLDEVTPATQLASAEMQGHPRRHVVSVTPGAVDEARSLTLRLELCIELVISTLQPRSLSQAKSQRLQEYGPHKLKDVEIAYTRSPRLLSR